MNTNSLFKWLGAFHAALLWAAVAQAVELPDISKVPADLQVPQMENGSPAAGKIAKLVAEAYRESKVHHCLYLPTDWQPGKKYPVICEYAGNGPFRNEYGDICTGKVEDCKLGYGISGGKRFIWVCLPFVSEDGQRNQLRWWGDIEATVDYCKTTVQQVCKDFGGDPEKVFLAGFSRGSIACNFIGLHDDEIASLWRGFICHSHYDGIKDWGYPGAVGEVAQQRLQRLNGRPQFISHEGSVEETQKYLQQLKVQGDFSFESIPFRNHTDTWVLRDIEARRNLRAWLEKQLK